MRVFLDTNVLASAVATQGLSADVFRVVITEHTLVTSDVVLTELRAVLERKLRVPRALAQAFEALLREHDVVPRPKAPASISLRDPDDAWVLASAVDGRADVLVTGDKDLLAIAAEAPVRIVNPRGFWTLLRKSHG